MTMLVMKVRELLTIFFGCNNNGSISEKKAPTSLAWNH